MKANALRSGDILTSKAKARWVSPRADRLWRVLEGVMLYLRTMVVFLVLWYVVALWIANPVLLPTPIAVAKSFFALAVDGEMAMHLLASARRLVFSFVLAGLVGIPLGIVMGLNRLIYQLVDPVIELLRPISGIAWIPIGLFIFGVGEALPTAIMFYGAFFPMVINTVASVRSVDSSYVNAARTLGAGRAVVLRHVILPLRCPASLSAPGSRQVPAGCRWSPPNSSVLRQVSDLPWSGTASC